MTIRCDFFDFQFFNSPFQYPLRERFATLAFFGVWRWLQRRLKRGGKAHCMINSSTDESHSIFTNTNASNQSLSQGITICRYYTCTGANDKILDHCLPRSSWPTTPIDELVLQDHIRRARLRGPLTVHSCPDGIPCLIDQHTGIITKPHHTSIRPLQLLLHAHHNRMSNITAADFVGESGGTASLGPGGPLLLDNDDYPVTWNRSPVSLVLVLPSVIVFFAGVLPGTDRLLRRASSSGR